MYLKEPLAIPSTKLSDEAYKYHSANQEFFSAGGVHFKKCDECHMQVLSYTCM
ncbi:hypothetical protein EC2875150_1283 [Escherichia coli 2875150]|nr:hypothetical protein EC2875150_1283 [Escherichia coli 2875150]